jgi:hypothetical protein
LNWQPKICEIFFRVILHGNCNQAVSGIRQPSSWAALTGHALRDLAVTWSQTPDYYGIDAVAEQTIKTDSKRSLKIQLADGNQQHEADNGSDCRKQKKSAVRTN